MVDLLRHTNTEAIIRDFNRQTGGGREDPVIHFYEEFLTAYDKTQKVQRGVYYTPQPVVNFIVRAVDDILKSEFGIAEGLASTEAKTIKVKRESRRKVDGFIKQVDDTEEVPAIQILDPATGTGTFLRQTIIQIWENFKAANQGKSETEINRLWNEYVPKHLLPRLNGFELMMAPYAVAHMKLAMVLKETGYDFSGDERVKVFLTNSLEEPGNASTQLSIFDDPLAAESVEANQAKKNSGINVVIGNPPYSGISSNGGEWITRLIEDYKYIDGVHFGERKHWLQDDYVKFIRMSEQIISQSENGILAFINNHAFLDNPTFRCMRYHLLQTFNRVFIINLHGNSLLGERCPDGEKDENVFDIQQGVSINIFIKVSNRAHQSLARINRQDIYGTRELKYEWLRKSLLAEIPWQEVHAVRPYYFFEERNLTDGAKYFAGISLKELFIKNVMGITTARDFLVIDSDRDRLLERMTHFSDLSYSDDQIRDEFFPGKQPGKYLSGDTRGWMLSRARRTISHFEHAHLIRSISYRPFDKRYIYYCPEMVDWDRANVMNNFIFGENLGLCLIRINRDNHCTALVVDDISDKTILSSKDNANVFPLFTYSGNGEHKVPNLDLSLVNIIEKRLGIKFVEKRKHNVKTEFDAFDLFFYIYSVLYSPSYCDKYADFLKSDFPCVPYPTNQEIFWKLVELGNELKLIHLVESSVFDDIDADPPVNGKNPIGKATYRDGNVYVNKLECFHDVPELAWNFYIGGYQPAQKWLKDRKGIVLSADDIKHYRKIIRALEETDRIMKEIDKVFEF